MFAFRDSLPIAAGGNRPDVGVAPLRHGSNSDNVRTAQVGQSPLLDPGS